jgi:hypothetical protein
VSPKYLTTSFCTAQHAGDDKKQIRQTIQVAWYVIVHAFHATERPDAPLGATHDGPSQMACGRCGATAREDELLQAREFGVESIERLLEAINVCLCDNPMPRNTQLCSNVEQIMLNFKEARSCGFGQYWRRQHHPNSAIGFVNAAVCFDPKRLLLDPGAIA